MFDYQESIASTAARQFLELLFGLGKLGDVGAGILKRDEMAGRGAAGWDHSKRPADQPAQGRRHERWKRICIAGMCLDRRPTGTKVSGCDYLVFYLWNTLTLSFGFLRLLK